MKRFLVALPTFKGYVGLNCETILVSAINKNEAIAKATRLKQPHQHIGLIKLVNY